MLWCSSITITKLVFCCTVQARHLIEDVVLVFFIPSISYRFPKKNGDSKFGLSSEFRNKPNIDLFSDR